MLSNPNTPTTLYQRISNSTDKLFFILYTLANTLSRRWYWVKYEIESTIHINDNYHNDNIYFCILFAKHPSDVHNRDKFSQWWTDWYEYTTCPDTGHIIYGDKVLFKPHFPSNQDKYIQWETEKITRPFNLEEISTTNPMRAKVKFKDLKHCRDIFHWKNILPPTIGSQTALKPLKQKTREKIKIKR